MSITVGDPDQAKTSVYVIKALHTTVNGFQFANNIQANLGEFVLQQMKEQGEQVFDGCFTTKKWSQSTNMIRKSSSNVLGCIVGQVTDAGHDACQDDLPFYKFRES